MWPSWPATYDKSLLSSRTGDFSDVVVYGDAKSRNSPLFSAIYVLFRRSLSVFFGVFGYVAHDRKALPMHSGYA